MCFSGGVAPDLNAALRRLQQQADVELDQEPDPSTPSTFEFEDCSVSVIHVPVPVPGDEVAQCAGYSRFWEPGSSTAHASHVIVTGFGGEVIDILERTVAVASAISTVAPSVCWYVGSASQVVEPRKGFALLETYDGAMPVWVNFLASEGAGGSLDSSTIGLEAFGHREFEVVGSKREYQAVFDQLMALSVYVLENGPVLKHGQTFGPSADERYSIELGPSHLGKPGVVIRLGL